MAVRKTNEEVAAMIVAATAGRRGRGKAAKSIELIVAAYAILTEIQPAKVRATCYQLFNGKLIRSMEKTVTNGVGKQLTWAREKEIIPWDWIVDDTREIERPATWTGPADILAEAARQYRRDWWLQQPVQILVVAEKAMEATIRPVIDEYGVGRVVFHGYTSTTKAHEVAEISVSDDDRPLIVLYCGDWDPSGMHMSEVDLPRRITKHGGRAEIRRIALVPDDRTALGPGPMFSADEKKKDPRYPWFIERYPPYCWELDALKPNILRARIEAAITEYIEWPAWKRCMEIQAAEQETLDKYVAAYPGVR